MYACRFNRHLLLARCHGGLIRFTIVHLSRHHSTSAAKLAYEILTDGQLDFITQVEVPLSYCDDELVGYTCDERTNKKDFLVGVELNPGPPKEERRSRSSKKSLLTNSAVVEALEKIAANDAVDKEIERSRVEDARKRDAEREKNRRLAISARALRAINDLDSEFRVNPDELSDSLTYKVNKEVHLWNKIHRFATAISSMIPGMGVVYFAQNVGLEEISIPKLCVTTGLCWLAAKAWLSTLFRPYVPKLKCRVQSLGLMSDPEIDLRPEYSQVCKQELTPQLFSMQVDFNCTMKQKAVNFFGIKIPSVKTVKNVSSIVQTASAEYVAQLLSPEVVNQPLTNEEVHDRMAFKSRSLHPINMDRFSSLDDGLVAANSVKAAYAIYRQHRDVIDKHHNFLIPQQSKANVELLTDTGSTKLSSRNYRRSKPVPELHLDQLSASIGGTLSWLPYSLISILLSRTLM